MNYINLLCLCIIVAGCGSDNREFDNPHDPRADKTSSNPSGATNPDDGTTNGTDPTCLTADCTPVTPSANSLALNSVKVIGDNCEMDSVTALKNQSANRITLIYRAKYASEGLWQLYARNITVNSDGTLALVGSGPTNLFTNVCVGNTSGVVGYAVTGYKSASTSKVYAYTDASNVTDFSVNMTCYNSALNGSNTFSALSLSPSAETTTSFLTIDGAIGYFKTQNVYVKSDGTTLNPNGSVNAFVVPGNWSNSGTNPLGKIIEIFGNDAAGGMYFKGGSNYYYLSSAGAVSSLSSDVYNRLGSLPIHLQGIGGIFHSIYGMYSFNTSRMYGYNSKAVISESSNTIGQVVGYGSDKILVAAGYNGLQKFDFLAGKFVTIGDLDQYYGYIETVGRYDSKSLFFSSGNCSLYLTGDFF